jgi:hypothetical protein
MYVRFKQQIKIKFCVKLGKTATETMQICDAYSDEALSRARVTYVRQGVGGGLHKTRLAFDFPE